jgi:hypothetical protein
MMQEIVLIFPDATTLIDFILQQKISNADVHSRELSLTVILSESQIKIACTKYGAVPGASLMHE